MDDRDRTEQLADCIGEDRQGDHDHPPASGVARGGGKLLGHDAGDPGALRQLVRLLIGRFGEQTEPGDKEQREGKEEHEEPVRECTGEEAASDLRVPVHGSETDVHGGVPLPGRLDLLPQDPDALGGPQRSRADRLAHDRLCLVRPWRCGLGRLGRHPGNSTAA